MRGHRLEDMREKGPEILVEKNSVIFPFYYL